MDYQETSLVAKMTCAASDFLGYFLSLNPCISLMSRMFFFMVIWRKKYTWSNFQVCCSGGEACSRLTKPLYSVKQSSRGLFRKSVAVAKDFFFWVPKVVWSFPYHSDHSVFFQHCHDQRILLVNCLMKLLLRTTMIEVSMFWSLSHQGSVYSFGMLGSDLDNLSQ